MLNFKGLKMGTNSHIFYEQTPGSFRGIYCNFDGNLNGVGITLYRHYTDIEKIKKLVNLGSIISLDKECDKNPQYQITSCYVREQRHKGYTFAYVRDLKASVEENKPIIENDIKQLEKFLHVYVWKDNQWITYNDEKKQWNNLKDEIIDYYKEVMEDCDDAKIEQYLSTPKTIELKVSYEEYMENIRRSFILVKKGTLIYSQKDYINIKTVFEGKNYELLVQVIDIVENDAINENYQLLILSKPPADYAWYSPMRYV